jgi:hypothetical protein
MPQTNEGILLFVGAIFFLIGLLGGGFEIAAIKMPSVGKYPRIISGGIGIIFMGIAVSRFIFPPLSPQPTTAPTVSVTSTTIAVAPTETPIPPTHTPVPPADTPVLPTNTPEPTNTPQPTPTLTSVPTRTPTPTPTTIYPIAVQTPTIPKYDDFDDGIVDSNKWETPPWGQTVDTTVTEENGSLVISAFGLNEGWFDLEITGQRAIREMSALVTYENITGDYNFGISLRAGDRYDLLINPAGNTAFLTTFPGGNNIDLEMVPLTRVCCPGEYLLSMRADGNQWHFLLNGHLVGSVDNKSYPNFGSLHLTSFAGQLSEVHINDVWVEFLK